MRLFKIGLIGSSCVIVGLIAYFSLRSSPRIVEVSWLPAWLGEWADENPDLRTAVPFVILGFLWPLIVWKWSSGIEESGKGYSRMKLSLISLAGLFGVFLLVVVMETGQLFLAGRNPSLMDVFWGGIGTFVGGAVGFCASFFVVTWR